MIYTDKQMETQAFLQVASAMCAAARTAPKTKGQDYIHTLVLTGEEQQMLANKMRQLGEEYFGENSKAWYGRDAANVAQAAGVVLIGVNPQYRGIPHCGICGFENCDRCESQGGVCAYNHIDLGIAVGSAVSVAADSRVDSRIMFSAGKGAMELGLGQPGVIWQGIPVSISGKSIFFDRVVK